jgi:flagellar basal body-associated protein FliL
MRFENLKQEKGVAGLTILLSLVVMLFIIGLIVMIFVLMSAELQDASFTSTAGTVTNETVTEVERIAGGTLDASDNRSVSCTAGSVYNGTTNIIDTSNYTFYSNCSIVNLTAIWITDDWLVSYTYTYDETNTATDVINDTGSAISEVVDWFSIFIVIGAMVVLILLTVIIITAIRGSGMIQTGNSTARGNVGSA